ncbi:MAG: serine/threonine protein kinase [Gammaproteobacteria bacterium]|nr:MAG: serine/threonine protein kinase [Gammaproteobacteria bacterium]
MDPNATPPSGVAINIPGYTLISELGKGGMATVYLAVQQNFGRKVALKIMSPALNADPTFSERFLREARIVAGLSHPNIVQVYDVGEFDNYHYIAMEYHPGGDLQERIAKGLSVEDSVRIIEQIALALDYAHSKGYIHRDVKPDNVLFREDGSAVLTDFGIAKPTSKNTRQMTQVGKVIGTPKYMSPEQARGQELDARSDLYALGVMFYEMLVGEVPFDGEDPIAIGIKHIKDPVPTLPAELAAFQEAMETILAKSVDDRYQRGRDFVEAIEQVAYLHDDGSRRASRGRLKASPSGRIGRVGTPARTQKVEKTGRPLLWLSLGTFTIVLAGIGAALFLLPNHPLVQQARQALPFQLPAPATTASTGPATEAPPEAIAPSASPATVPATTPATTATATPVATATDNTAALTGDTPAAPEAATTPVTSAAAAPTTDMAQASTPTQPASDTTGTMPTAATANTAEAPLPAADEPVTAQAVTAEPRDDSLQPLIDRLLAEAGEAIEQRQLTSPAGQSALDKYNEILELDPDNVEAQNGIRKVATTYVVMAREAADRREFRRARGFLAQAREIAADAAGLDSAEKSIASAEEDAARQQREAERIAAAKAREANKTDDMVARFRITGLLKSAEYQLANNQLAAPAGENAWESYGEVLKLDPGNSIAKAGRQKVETQLVSQLQAAVDSLDGNKARELMSQALRVIPNNPRIKQLRAEIDTLP